MFLLSGCWDRKELEDRAYVIGLGLDQSKTEGKIKVTMLIANPEVGSMQGGGGSSEKPKKLFRLMPMILFQRKAQPMRLSPVR